MKPIYLIHYTINGMPGKAVMKEHLNIESINDLLVLEKLLKKEGKHLKSTDVLLILSISRLPQDIKPQEDKLDDSIRFVVNNVTTGTSHLFSFRNEAIDFYRASIEEKGDGAEYELLMRLEHHCPSN